MAQGTLALRLGFPGVGASFGLLLCRSRLELSPQAEYEENEQNGDGDNGEGDAHCAAPSFL
jgi:hypothetical protein